eukprot:gene30697-biopygen19681
MPEGFAFPETTQLWQPFPDDQMTRDEERGSHGFPIYARMKPGIELSQVQTELDTFATRFEAAYPKTNTGLRFRALLVREEAVRDEKLALQLMLGAVLAVLLIACANIANLFLARVSARQKEIAVRLSLGAGRGEVIRQFLAESAVFTLLAGGLGVLLAWWSLRGIQLLAGPQLPRADEIGLDPFVLAFSLGVAVVAALLIGLYPALQASRTDVGLVLKDTSRGAGGGKAAKAFRHLLVVAQVALSLALLICAGLLVRSFYNLQQANLGFATAGRAYGVVNLPSNKYNKPELTREFFRRLHERLAQTPELASGAAITGLPLSGQGFISPYAVKGRPIAPIHERPLANIRMVTPGYFATVDIKLRDGRFFTDADRFGGEQVAIINETLAKKIFPGENPVGQFFLLGPAADNPVRIVGLIRDVKAAGLAVPPPDEIYYPRDQRGGAFMAIVAQAKPGLAAAAVIPVLRRVLADLDPTVA